MIDECSEDLPVRCIWLYVLVMSHTRLRVNPQSIVAWMSRNFLLEADAKSEVLSDCNWTFRQLECGFTLKRVRDVIRTYSQMHRTDKYSQHSSVIWPVWLNGWVFVYELSACGFESSCSHLIVLLFLRFCFCFQILILKLEFRYFA